MKLRKPEGVQAVLVAHSTNEACIINMWRKGATTTTLLKGQHQLHWRYGK